MELWAALVVAAGAAWSWWRWARWRRQIREVLHQILSEVKALNDEEPPTP